MRKTAPHLTIITRSLAPPRPQLEMTRPRIHRRLSPTNKIVCLTMAYNVKSECHTWKARISHSRHFRTANAIIDISPGGGGPGKGEFRIHTSHALHPSVQPHST